MMTTHLDQHILSGELQLFEHELRGILQLRGLEHPIRLNLTVVGRSPWQGFSFYFEAPETAEPVPSAGSPILASEQIGPLGNHILSGLTPDGEAIDVFQADCFYLDWYSQNGHLSILVEQAHIEQFDDSKPLQAATAPAGPFFDRNMLEKIEKHRLVPKPIGTDDPPDIMTEIIEMDHWIESSKTGTALGAQFQPRLAPPPPEQLSDRELGTELRILLAQLARLGITLDWCAHFTPRKAYEYLVSTLLQRESFDAFIPFHTVRQFSTCDDCPDCEAEFELELTEGE